MTRNKKKIIRTVTVPQSIGFFREVMCRMEKMGYESVVVTSPGKQLDDFRKECPQFRTIEKGQVTGHCPTLIVQL